MPSLLFLEMYYFLVRIVYPACYSLEFASQPIINYCLRLLRDCISFFRSYYWPCLIALMNMLLLSSMLKFFQGFGISSIGTFLPSKNCFFNSIYWHLLQHLPNTLPFFDIFLFGRVYNWRVCSLYDYSLFILGLFFTPFGLPLLLLTP